jgi:hypothetical protein
MHYYPLLGIIESSMAGIFNFERPGVESKRCTIYPQNGNPGAGNIRFGRIGRRLTSMAQTGLDKDQNIHGGVVKKSGFFD